VIAGLILFVAAGALVDPLRSRLVVAVCALGGLAIGAAIVLDLVGYRGVGS
jgi:hypothetical protein